MSTFSQFDERDLRECRTNNCARKHVVVWAPGRKNCSLCDHRLKGLSWRSDKCLSVVLDPLVETQKSLALGAAQTEIPRIVDGQSAPPEGFKAICFRDFQGGLPSYLAYLKNKGVEGYLSFNDWWKDNKGGEWRDYDKFLATLGIAPPIPTPATSRVVPITTKTWSKPDNDTFTCTVTDLKDCPIMKDKKAPIHIPNRMWESFIYLAKVFTTEWIAYLKGRQQEDGIYLIESMYFPKQKANGAHVDAEDGQVQEGTIGAIHSHVAMSAFFSEEDKKHANHEIELVINRKGEWDASVRTKLECSRYTRIGAAITLIGDEQTKALVADLEVKLTEEKPVTVVTGYHEGHFCD